MVGWKEMARLARVLKSSIFLRDGKKAPAQRAEPVEFLTIGPSFAIFWSALKILPFLENIGS